MQTSGLPTRIAVPFADAGTKNTIPVASQIGITGGAASFTTGFPPLTMTPVSAGGIPPFGADFNGILNAITNAIRWNIAGSGYPFDSTFATAVTGYPKGALLPASDFSGYWLNTQEANTTTPENSTSATTGWVPGVHYGATAVTGLSSSSVTLTTLQAAKARINLSGTLTANINLVFPAWVKSWTVANNCTGNFSVTCKTPSGSGVAILAGFTAVINGDGTNITQDTNVMGSPGRLLAVKYITASGTYTPTAGTKSIRVKVLSGGGAGGGGAATTSSQVGVGAGGNSGSYAESNIIDASAITSVVVTVGAGGIPSAGAAGGNGGTSSFGAYIVCPGGAGGYAGVAGTPGICGPDNGNVTTPTGTALAVIVPTRAGTGPFTIDSTPSNGVIKSGRGGDSAIGTGGYGITGLYGAISGSGYGAGGGGAAVGPSSAAAQAGGSGTSGVIIVEELS